MRLTRPRVLLRALLLLVLAGFMAWRALEARGAAAEPLLEPGSATLLSRLAVVEAILSALALLTAAVALASLRQRPRRHLLHLRPDEAPGPPKPAPGPAGTGGESNRRYPGSDPTEPT